MATSWQVKKPYPSPNAVIGDRSISGMTKVGALPGWFNLAD
jgi:hypothetical protein